MKGHFLMRQEHRDRIDVLKSVRKKVMRLKEAAVVLGISYRQCRRIYRRYLDESREIVKLISWDEGECGPETSSG